MKRFFLSMIFLGVFHFPSISQSVDLGITPVIQQTQVWCWVSVGEMIFRYYNVCAINPVSYQCGIIALLAPGCNVNCLNCQVPAQSMDVMRNMISQYPTVAQQVCQSGVQTISSSVVYSNLAPVAVVNQIDASMPVVAGISPGGNTGYGPAHVALITGYQVYNNYLYLIVNDPYPYSPYDDPYVRNNGQRLATGRYLIAYNAFLALNWTASLYNVR